MTNNESNNFYYLLKNFFDERAGFIEVSKLIDRQVSTNIEYWHGSEI